MEGSENGREEKRKDERGNVYKLFLHIHLFDVLIERKS